MLVIARHVGESIEIIGPDGIAIRIMPVRLSPVRREVRIGIDAPESYRVVRPEIVGRLPRTEPIYQTTCRTVSTGSAYAVDIATDGMYRIIDERRNVVFAGTRRECEDWLDGKENV